MTMTAAAFAIFDRSQAAARASADTVCVKTIHMDLFERSNSCFVDP